MQRKKVKAQQDGKIIRVREEMVPVLEAIRDQIVADFEAAGRPVRRPSASYAVEAAIRTLSGIQSGEIVSLPREAFANLMGKYSASVATALMGQSVEVEITPEGHTYKTEDGEVLHLPKPPAAMPLTTTN